MFLSRACLKVHDRRGRVAGRALFKIHHGRRTSVVARPWDRKKTAFAGAEVISLTIAKDSIVREIE